jgi:hypothetical protein
VAFGVLFVLVPLIIFTVGYYRTARMTVCPETGNQVHLDIDAVHAGLTAAAGRPRLRVRWCTLWPQKRGCAQECVAGGEIRRPPARPGA